MSLSHGAAGEPAIARLATVGAKQAPIARLAGVTPHLRLSAETLFVDDGSRRGDELRVAALKLDFDYAGARVRANDPLPRIYDQANLARGPVNRHPAAETTCRRVLESLGAVELAGLDDCAVGVGIDVDYVVRIDGDIHALCAFAAYGIPQLRRLGWTIEIDPDYPWQVVDNAAPLYTDVAADARRPDWFSIELGVEIEGVRVSLLPALLEMLEQAVDLDALLRANRRCVAVRIDEKRWLPVPPERLARLCKVLRELYKDGDRVGVPASRAAVIAELGAALYSEERPVRWTGDTAIRDRAYALAMGPAPQPATIPVGLQASMRSYQEDGLRWLQHLRINGAGGILADDMGLGKTLQTIAHVLAEKEGGRLTRPAMIITLTSLVPNWQRECARFAPSLKVLALHGPHRKSRFAEMASHDVVITTYPLVHRDLEVLSQQEFHLLVLDEAHAIKNHTAQAHEAVRGLHAVHMVALSGTPIENNLGELWSLMDFVMPGMLGSTDEFRHRFRTPIEDAGDAARLVDLRDRVRPYILRRTKAAVATELPPKTELVQTIELDGAQRELYEHIRIAAHADVREHIKTRGFGGSTIAILDALLKLRQVCCDPRLVKVDAAKDAIASGQSAKLDHLLQMVEVQRKEGHRILIFSQFARMLTIISESLLGRGIGHATLTGQTADRQKAVDTFESGRVDVFLISLRAGGTGLNLTSADTVIHYDPWWNPAAQAQATDRAYRIGQTKPVFAYNLIAAGSVEERMLGLQRHKRALADGILDAGGVVAPSLSARDIDDLLSPLK